jgi:hypothetical protein
LIKLNIMTAKELRIGNLVNYHNDDYRIVLIAEDLIKIDIGFGAVQRFEKDPIYSPHLDDLKPIPLTKEWLLKFGVRIIQGRYYLDDIIFFERNLRVCRPLCTRDYIKYVHQIQNLYFALTGRELEIKE